ncbi:MAG: sulfotransferase [Promethearchaeota archaeon]
MSSLGVTFSKRYFNKRQIFKRFYHESNHDLENTILIDGVGRSGTTWLAEILAEILHYRQIFEPFKPDKLDIFSNFQYKEYIPPTYENEEYYKIFKRILSGKIKNKWIDQDNRVFKSNGRIIKSIRASFFLKWIKNNFPEIPIIFMMRHPCAVTNSRKQLGWSENELELFLAQDNLVKEHLKPYLSIIKDAKTLVQKNACIWCIQNLIALNTMDPDDWLIITYEHLFMNTEDEIRRILNFIGYGREFNPKKLKNRYSLQTLKHSDIITHSKPLEAWRTKLTKDEISAILNIVRAFSLDNLYDIESMPKKKFN